MHKCRIGSIRSASAWFRRLRALRLPDGGWLAASNARALRYLLAGLLSALLAACANPPMRPDPTDITAESVASATLRPKLPHSDAVPDLVDTTPAPRPRDTPHLERYSVVVSDVEIRELLFAMARDAKVNVDVDPRIYGKVSINAIDQTLPQILNRLARQIDLRYEFDGKTLLVQADVPYLHQYPIDYVNMTRDTKSSTAIATQIASAGGSPVSPGGGGGSSNNSTTEVTISATNHFWDSLVNNVSALLGVTPTAKLGAGVPPPPVNPAATAPVAPSASPVADRSGAAGPAPTTPGAPPATTDSLATLRRVVIASPETGILTVRATQREHERVQALISRMISSAHRQVLIEATIAEVQLSEQYQQGINWSKMNLNGAGWSFTQQPNGTLPLTSGALANSGPGGIVFPTVPPSPAVLPGGATNVGTAATPSLGVLRYLDTGSHGNIGIAVSLLQSFGKVKVLSSPKLSVLNNQTAVLKVVDNLVYFTITVNVTPGNASANAVVAYVSTPNTVPVGLVMSVTPEIDDKGAVTINLRPTISRVIDYVDDPNPALAQAGTVSRVPEIETRELESVMKVNTGDIAVMGGLMQESVNNQRDQIPGAGSLPFIGNLFRYVNDSSTKSELVIFLRPTVVLDASLEGDYANYRQALPDENFFGQHPEKIIPREWTQ
jgi:general secretion pathway protein D